MSRRVSMSSSHDLGDGLIQLKAVLRIRIRKDPHHFAGSGSATKPMDPDPDPGSDLWCNLLIFFHYNFAYVFVVWPPVACN